MMRHHMLPWLLTIFSLLLAACGAGPSPTPETATVTPTTTVLMETPTPTGTTTPVLTPAASETPQPTETPTPQSLQQSELKWAFAGEHAVAPDCGLQAGVSGFLLGMDPSACSPSLLGGSAEAVMEVPPSSNSHVLLVTISCGSGGCRDSLQLPAGAQFTISINNQPVWQISSQADSTDGLYNAAQYMEDELRVTYTIPPSAGRQEFYLRLDVTHSAVLIGGATYTLEPLPQQLRGIAFSPFRNCQNPNWGPFPDESQVLEDLVRVQQMGNAIRTYSSLGVQGEIPLFANRMGLKVAAGAMLGPNKDKNEQEISALIKLAHTAVLDSVIVGSEVLLRNDMSEDELIGYIQRVKSAVDVPVTYAEIGGILLQHPKVMEAVDYEMVHLYAYWDGVPIDQAAREVARNYHLIQSAAKGKRVVIGETGWPSAGPTVGQAVPSYENQRRFAREFFSVAEAENIDFYYFSAFDEMWKTEGGVGAYWGLLDTARQNKYDVYSALMPYNVPLAPERAIQLEPTGTPGPAPAEDESFYIYQTYASQANHYAPSGWMGDWNKITFDDCALSETPSEGRIIKITYLPTASDPNQWAGIYWQDPENNWGNKIGGYNLTGYTELRFKARAGDAPFEVSFFSGGINTGDHPSSLAQVYAMGADKEGYVKVTGNWQEFHIDLRGKDLTDVIDGFGWVTNLAHAPDGMVLYLADIRFDHDSPA